MTFGCFARRTWWHCASFLVLRQIGNLRASCELRHLPLFMYALVLPRVLLGAECALRCVRPCAHIPYRRYDYRYPIPIILVIKKKRSPRAALALWKNCWPFPCVSSARRMSRARTHQMRTATLSSGLLSSSTSTRRRRVRVLVPVCVPPMVILLLTYFS